MEFLFNIPSGRVPGDDLLEDWELNNTLNKHRESIRKNPPPERINVPNNNESPNAAANGSPKYTPVGEINQSRRATKESAIDRQKNTVYLFIFLAFSVAY